MYDLVNYRREKGKKHFPDCPKGILDVIEADYPQKYFLIRQDGSLLTTLFSDVEWLDILTKSRNSYSGHVQRKNLPEKAWAQGI